MKSTILKLLLLVLAMAMVFSVASCGKDSGDGTTDNGAGNTDTAPPSGDSGGDTDSENLVLIKDSKALFSLVLATGTDGSTRKAVETFISDLKDIGVEIDQYINDSDASAVTDCEIIVGTGVRNRDAKYVLNARDYGDDGYIIKVVDNKLLIGGGTAAQTKTAFEYFIKNVIKLSSKTKDMESFEVERNYEKLKETKYLIDSVEIGGTDLSNYVFVSNVENKSYTNVKEFRETLYAATGY